MFYFQWLLPIALILSFLVPTKAFAKSSSSSSVPLSFQVGTGVSLEPQELPPFLHGYHTQAIVLSGEAFEDTNLECIRDISYGPEPRNRLDVWKSSLTTTADRPVVVFLQGGGWDWGYKEWTAFVAPHMCAQEDAILVTPSYAIGKGENTIWPDSRDDVLSVLKWIQTSISKYGGDPSRVILAGHSAGGHLAACVGLDPALMQSNNFSPESIRGLFLISAPLGIRAQDFLPRLWRFRVTRPLANLLYRLVIIKNLRPVVGEKGTDRVLAAQDASPLSKLESTDSSKIATPLVHYTYGAKGDFPFCRPHLRRLKALLGKDRVQSLELPVEGHFDTHFALADPNCEWYTALHQVLAKTK